MRKRYYFYFLSIYNHGTQGGLIGTVDIVISGSPRLYFFHHNRLFANSIFPEKGIDFHGHRFLFRYTCTAYSLYSEVIRSLVSNCLILRTTPGKPAQPSLAGLFLRSEQLGYP